jgi:hypothetical protein
MVNAGKPDEPDEPAPCRQPGSAGESPDMLVVVDRPLQAVRPAPWPQGSRQGVGLLTDGSVAIDVLAAGRVADDGSASRLTISRTARTAADGGSASTKTPERVNRLQSE